MALDYYRWPLEEQTVLPPAEPRRVETISAIGDTNPGKYVPHPELIDAVNVALVLGMPLLITGEPGCGKSELARSLAFQLGFMGPFKFVAKSNSQSRDLFYRYDALGRFYAIQAKQGARAENVLNFIEYTALGKAILLAHSRNDVEAFLPSFGGPRQPDWMTRPVGRIGPPWWQAERKRSVVLIDEIDKAPRDFANDLLDELDKMQFQVSELQEAPTPEFGPRYNLRPVVIITSNQERQLPDAFLRRCLYFHISFPQRRPRTGEQTGGGDNYFIEDIVTERLGAKFSNAAFLNDALDFFYALREPRLGLRKPPATAELLNWLVAMGEDSVNTDEGLRSQDRNRPPEEGYVRRSITTLLKNPDDYRKGLEYLQVWLRSP